jgi:hypothetical protein
MMTVAAIDHIIHHASIIEIASYKKTVRKKGQGDCL